MFLEATRSVTDHSFESVLVFLHQDGAEAALVLGIAERAVSVQVELAGRAGIGQDGGADDGVAQDVESVEGVFGQRAFFPFAVLFGESKKRRGNLRKVLNKTSKII